MTGNNEATIDCLVKKLMEDFAMKDLGSLGFFFGIQETRNSTSLHLQQSKYVLDLLNKIKMTDAKPYRSLCVLGTKMSKFDSEPFTNPTEYRQVVGALQYATLTQPNIAYYVNQLCQHIHNPTSSHWTATKRVLRYLKGSVNCGLLYSKEPIALHTYCNSDWAGNPDDRRSTSGFGIFLGSSLISWFAKKQHIVSRSSTEAEYHSMALATAELFWLQMLLQELHIPLHSPPTSWCDNAGALTLTSNLVSHAHTKHIEVDVHFIREKVANKDISIRYISTLDQVADIFTKGHIVDRFEFL